MRYKTLLTGTLTSTIESIFTDMDENMRCMTCSIRYKDIVRHIKEIRPDLFILCLKSESKEEISYMANVKNECRKYGTVFVLIGSEKDCDRFNMMVNNKVADITLVRPITNKRILNNIDVYMENRNKNSGEEWSEEEWREIEKEEQEKKEIERQKNEKTEKEKQENEKLNKDRLEKEKQENEKLNKERLEKEKADRELLEQERLESEHIRREREKLEKKRQNRKRLEEGMLELEELEQEILRSNGIGNGKENKEPKVEKAVVTPPARKHILVIDDDINILKLLQSQLSDKYDVATAINGVVALKFLEKRSTDLILLDYEMPVKNGPMVLGELRQNEATRDIPVVFLTGVSGTDKIMEVLSMKPRGYLLKPVDYKELEKTLKDILG